MGSSKGISALIVVTYHDDLKEVQGDAVLARWLEAPAAAAPFDRLAWWHLLSAHQTALPLIAVARSGKARAAVPLRRKGRQIEALANWYSFRVRPVLTPGADRTALLTALAADLAGQAPRIDLAPLPDEDGSATALAAAFRASGWAVLMQPCDTNHYLDLRGRSFAEFLAARPGAVRTTLKRKGKRVRVVVETAFDAASWAAYEAVYAQSWKPEEGSPALLRAFAQAEGAAGRLRLGLAFDGDVPVAAQFWTVENGTAFIHKLAHAETAKALSPGTTLSAALFAHVIDRDEVTTVDFGTGDNAYKRDWMEQSRPRYRLEAYRPGWPGNWPAIIKCWLRGLARRSDHG